MDIDAFIESLMKTERPAKFPHSMYYTEGTKYLNLCLYPKALEFLNNAVKNNKTHVRSLLKRSKCFIALREYQKALADANKALELCPNSIEAIDLKGQAQYLMGDFEGGYLTYFSGREMKPANNNFRLGKQLCREALDNSMNPARKILINKTDVDTLMKTKRDDKSFENSLKYLRSKRDCFGKDKKFMEELMKKKNLSSVHGFCEEAVDHIKGCERFWAMQKPLQTRKNIPQVVRRGDQQKTELCARQLFVCKAALCRAEKDLNEGRIDDSISEAEKILRSAESLPKKMEMEKLKLKCDAFHLIGLSYRKLDNLLRSRRYLLKELEIANEFDLAVQKTRAYHLLGEHYQLQGNISKALQCFNKVSEAMDSKQIEVVRERASAEEIAHLESAQEWMNNVVSDVRMSLRESIYSPIIDTMGELFKALNSGNLDKTNRTENVQNGPEQAEQKTSRTNEKDELNVSSGKGSSIVNETSKEYEDNPETEKILSDDEEDY